RTRTNSHGTASIVTVQAFCLSNGFCLAETLLFRVHLSANAHGHDLYFLDHPPLRRCGLGSDHLCIADAAGQMGASAQRPLGGGAFACLFRGYIARLPCVGAPVRGGWNDHSARRVPGGPAKSPTESPAQSSGLAQRRWGSGGGSATGQFHDLST